MNFYLYKIIADGEYGQGVAIVAATSELQAREIAATIKVDDVWNVSYANPVEVELLESCSASGAPRVVTHFETGA